MAKRKGGFIGQDGINAPDPATGVSASGGDTQVDVSFTPPSDVGGADVTEYRVTDSTGAHTASGSASPVTVTGLTNGTYGRSIRLGGLLLVMRAIQRHPLHPEACLEEVV